MNLSTYIKEKRAEFDEAFVETLAPTGMRAVQSQAEDIETFLESCLTQLVEKMEEELIVAEDEPENAEHPHYEQFVHDWQEREDVREETRRRFHLFKTGEEHTGV